MQKIIKIDTKVIVMFEDGSYCERDGVSQEEFNKIAEVQSDEEVYCLMYPEYSKKLKEYTDTTGMLEDVDKSDFLVKEGDSIYWKEVSGLSLPPELVKAILEAERDKNEVRLDTYRNFWTLMSLNPDERCRKNLFWFLNRNGLVISRCGFFVAYRNANLKGKDEDGTEVYTDAHTGTFSIRIGKVVTMPREKCDDVQENTCSRGLVCSPVY